MNDSQSELMARIREALEVLLRESEQMRDKAVGDVIIGPDMLVVTLRERSRHILEGEWEDTSRTIDLFDLMDRFQEGPSSAAHQLLSRSIR